MLLEEWLSESASHFICQTLALWFLSCPGADARRECLVLLGFCSRTSIQETRPLKRYEPHASSPIGYSLMENTLLTRSTAIPRALTGTYRGAFACKKNVNQSSCEKDWAQTSPLGLPPCHLFNTKREQKSRKTNVGTQNG